MKRPARTPRTVTVIVRGCRFRVPAHRAAAIRRADAALVRADWDANRLD